MESILFFIDTMFFFFLGDDVSSSLLLYLFNTRYYQFDKVVVRELLGKKLTGRLRKDLDDISEKTNIPLKSCRRQVGCHDSQFGAKTGRRGMTRLPKVTMILTVVSA